MKRRLFLFKIRVRRGVPRASLVWSSDPCSYSLGFPQESPGISEHSLNSTALSHLWPLYNMNYFFKISFPKTASCEQSLKAKIHLDKTEERKCRIGSENRVMCKLVSSLKDWKGKIPLNFLTQNRQQASISLHILATDLLHRCFAFTRKQELLERLNELELFACNTVQNI